MHFCVNKLNRIKKSGKISQFKWEIPKKMSSAKTITIVLFLTVLLIPRRQRRTATKGFSPIPLLDIPDNRLTVGRQSSEISALFIRVGWESQRPVLTRLAA